jgi:hypothetical protein
MVISTSTSAYAEEDVIPPELVGLSVSPTAVDTSGGSAAVTFTLHVTDNLAGVSLPGVILRGPSGQTIFAAGADDPVSGTAQDGIYQIVVDMPQYSAQGTWTIFYFEISDHANNVGYFDNEYLTAAGYPSQIFNEPAPSC